MHFALILTLNIYLLQTMYLINRVVAPEKCTSLSTTKDLCTASAVTTASNTTYTESEC